MDFLTKQTIKTARSFTYTYYTCPPADAKLPTIFLAHGWPDSADMWSDLIRTHLKPAGYGIIAIDCLGYAGTSKPTDPAAYAFSGMAADVMDILDAEKVDKVISLGHDWGCGLAQRVYNHYPERVTGLVMMNVSYLAPTGDPIDVDQIIQITTQFFGYGTWHYWKLFTADDGAQICSDHTESLFEAAHGRPESWLQTLCKADGLRNFLLENKHQPTEAYATAEKKAEFLARMKRDGFEAPMCWYKAMTTGVQPASDKTISKDAIVVKVPTLFIAGAHDKVCRPELIGQSQEQGLLPHLTVVSIDAGHWCMLAKPKEVGDALVKWLTDHY